MINIDKNSTKAEVLEGDREVVLSALGRRSYSLSCIGESLHNDIAVKQKGCALEYASDELKANREVINAAGLQDSDALFFADIGIKS